MLTESERAERLAAEAFARWKRDSGAISNSLAESASLFGLMRALEEWISALVSERLEREQIMDSERKNY